MGNHYYDALYPSAPDDLFTVSSADSLVALNFQLNSTKFKALGIQESIDRREFA